MKREYTLLTLGILIMILPWLGLTASLRQIVFTLIGAWITIISYKYWRSKRLKTEPEQQGTQSANPVMNASQNEPIENQQIDNQHNYERRQDTKPRI